jgi:carboxyl-terminal processing protease
LSSDRAGGFGPGVVTGLVIGLLAAALFVVVSGVLTDDDDPVVHAREVIEDNYFHEPDPAKLDDASIEGMVEALKKRYDDKFSHYFTAEQLKDFIAATSGRFSGVGLTVTEVAKGLRVASVLPDTPAEEAGLEEGDLIVAVDGKSIAGVSSDVSTARIKGPEGTEVELRIVPADGSKPRDLTLERADVRVPAVDGRIGRDAEDEKIAYVLFHTFSEGAHGELRDEIERLDRRGAEGLVLDLRGNGGGLLNEAVLSASIFLEDGNVVSTRSRTQGDKDYPATGDAIEPRPAVVLVNRDTASAAEILAAALQQNDLAEIVGTRTYGKGTFQEVMDLPAGGALDLTIGEYLTADGTSILGEGVKPDVRVADDPDTEGRDEAFDRALEVVGERIPAGTP